MQRAVADNNRHARHSAAFRGARRLARGQHTTRGCLAGDARAGQSWRYQPVSRVRDPSGLAHVDATTEVNA
jgi:hypothetical protein